MTDPDVERRLRQLELDINASAPLPAQQKQSTSLRPSSMPGWQWVLAGIGAILALGLVLRLLDLGIKLAIMAAIGYGLYRWLIVPRLRQRRPH